MHTLLVHSFTASTNGLIIACGHSFRVQDWDAGGGSQIDSAGVQATLVQAIQSQAKSARCAV